MVVRFRSWRMRIRQRRMVIVVTTAIIMVAIVLIIIGYSFDWTGFNGYTQVSTVHTLSGPAAGTVTRTEVYQPGKTLWDWLQLFIIPAVLAVAGYVINLTISRSEQKATTQRAKTERDIAEDNQREAALKEYIDKLSELMLHENLRKSKPGDEVRKIAHVLTLTVLPRLDEGRKRGVLQFLYESGLIGKDTSIIDLGGADLSKTNLSHDNLRGASLRGAILRQVTLGGANLSEADLSKSDLWGANFNGAIGGFTDLTTIGGPEFLVLDSYDGGIEADLRGADLSEAMLYGSNATREQLNQAKSFKGATMPDGSRHP
jgi:uncharacterized protein YjbI with pentapeptide repeats